MRLYINGVLYDDGEFFKRTMEEFDQNTDAQRLAAIEEHERRRATIKDMMVVKNSD